MLYIKCFDPHMWALVIAVVALGVMWLGREMTSMSSDDAGREEAGPPGLDDIWILC